MASGFKRMYHPYANTTSTVLYVSIMSSYIIVCDTIGSDLLCSDPNNIPAIPLSISLRVSLNLLYLLI